MRRPWYLLGLSLAFSALFVFSFGNAFVTALAYIVYGGYLTLLIRHLHHEQVVFDDLFTVTDFRFVSFAFLALIKAFFIILGFICFIIPGMYLAVRWMFAEILVVDQGMRPLEALRASSQLTEGVRFKLFLFSLLMILAMLIGVVFLVIGVFVAINVSLFAYITLYEELKNERVAATISDATTSDDVVVTI